MNRRLSAILAADVVGYASMVRADQAATLDALRRLRDEVYGPVLAANRGRIINSMGDGWLIEFRSAVDAVSAALQVQARLRETDLLLLRIGIHIGDVVETEHDFHGDGINIAARLENAAPPGGILISDAVHASLDGTLAPSFRAAGTRELKNIDRPVITWQHAPAESGLAVVPSTASARSDFPRLCIAPVATADQRPEIAELANALTADLHARVSSINWMVAQIGELPDPGAYVIRPTLRARGEKLRLETRLFGPDGGAVWSAKSDSTLDDSFDWQDEVATAVATAATERIFETETLRLSRIPEEALTAEQHHLIGMMAWRTFSNEAFVRSVDRHSRAIAMKPDFADAYAEAIIVLNAARTNGSRGELEPYRARMPAWIEAARPLAPGNAALTYAIGVADFMEDRRLAPLNQVIAQVLRLAPFNPRLLSFCGWACLWSGQMQAALDCQIKSLRHGMQGPFTIAAYGCAGTACVQLGRLDDALAFSEQGLKLSDVYGTLYSVKAAALALKGQHEAARDTMRRFLELRPDQTLAEWRRINPYGGDDGADRYFEGLRLAGLPPE